MAAARAWAAGTLIAAQPDPSHEPEAIADARRFGASAEELAGLADHLGVTGAASVAVWPDNVETVAAFVVAATQWRTTLDVVDGRLRLVRTGLDYAGVRISIEASGLAITPTIWTGLRVMEHAAMAALNGETVH